MGCLVEIQRGGGYCHDDPAGWILGWGSSGHSVDPVDALGVFVDTLGVLWTRWGLVDTLDVVGDRVAL